MSRRSKSRSKRRRGTQQGWDHQEKVLLLAHLDFVVKNCAGTIVSKDDKIERIRVRLAGARTTDQIRRKIINLCNNFAGYTLDRFHDQAYERGTMYLTGLPESEREETKRQEMRLHDEAAAEYDLRPKSRSRLRVRPRDKQRKRYPEALDTGLASVENTNKTSSDGDQRGISAAPSTQGANNYNKLHDTMLPTIHVHEQSTNDPQGTVPQPRAVSVIADSFETPVWSRDSSRDILLPSTKTIACQTNPDEQSTNLVAEQRDKEIIKLQSIVFELRTKSEADEQKLKQYQRIDKLLKMPALQDKKTIVNLEQQIVHLQQSRESRSRIEASLGVENLEYRKLFKVDSIVDDWRTLLEKVACIVPHDLLSAIRLPPEIAIDDLASLVRSSFCTDLTMPAPWEDDQHIRVHDEPAMLLKSLASAAFCEWVFLTEVQDVMLMVSPLFHSFKQAVRNGCGSQAFQSLESAAFLQVLQDPYFGQRYVPIQARVLAERFLYATVPFFHSFDLEGLRSSWMNTLETMFRLALRIKLRAVVHRYKFEIYWPAPKATVSASHVEDHEQCRTSTTCNCLTMAPGLFVTQTSRASVDLCGFTRKTDFKLGQSGCAVKAIVVSSIPIEKKQEVLQ